MGIARRDLTILGVAEAPAVPGMEEGSFPDLRLGGYEIEEAYLDAEQRRELEEERRLAYVAITRARDRLVLSCAQERMRNGQFLLPDPSRFLSEIPEEVITTYGYERQRPVWGHSAFRPAATH